VARDIVALKAQVTELQKSLTTTDSRVDVLYHLPEQLENVYTKMDRFTLIG